jgi:hypothetical protein
MKKLKLQLESLHVESFDTHRAAPGDRGTVRANGLTTQNDQAYTDGLCTWFCFTITCICGSTEKQNCSAGGCPHQAEMEQQ